MALIAPQEFGVVGGKIVLWEGVTESDTCLPVTVDSVQDKTVQVLGTFGAATVILQGTLQPRLAHTESPTYFSLSDSTGTTISLTAAGGVEVLEAVHRIRPSASGGTGQDLDIYLYCANATRR